MLYILQVFLPSWSLVFSLCLWCRLLYRFLTWFAFAFIYIFFFKEFIYLFTCLFIYLFLAALGLRCCARAFFSCGKQGLLFVAVHGLLITVASLAAEYGL